MLRGERVVLRPIQREDLPRVWELSAELEVKARRSTRPPRPRSRAELEAEFERDLLEPPADVAWFGVEVDGDLIGDCVLYEIDHFRGTAELGIGLLRTHWGKGYGRDAVRTLVAYGFRHLNLRRIGLEVLADDPRAVGAYRGAGFVEDGRLRRRDWFDGAFRDVLVMSLLREEWPERD